MQLCDVCISAAPIGAGITINRALKASFWLQLIFWLVWLTAMYTFALISLQFGFEALHLLAQAVREGGFSNATFTNGYTVSELGKLSPKA